MGFIRDIVEQHQKKVLERNSKCESLIAEIESALHDAENILSDSDDFIEPIAADKWKQRHKKLLSDTDIYVIQRLKKSPRYRELSVLQRALFSCSETLLQKIREHNEYVAETKIRRGYSILGKVEGISLDRQQMICVLKEAHNHLVIAGAGTGKTTTIVARIKYMLKIGRCLPKDILVLSFTNVSATEMSKRIQAETGQELSVSTFHKLGLNIITKVNGIKPKISQMNMRDFIKRELAACMESDAYLKMLSEYLLYNRVVPKSEFDFSTQSEYDEYLRLNPPTTLRNELVKSYGELDIANFLTENGLTYIYENPYKVDTRTSEYGQYHPDFYLPDYDIYIEYFGVNRNNETPKYFDPGYQASMEWKRKLHTENGTQLVECFAYEKFKGSLLDNLSQKLQELSVTMVPKPAQELWRNIVSEGDSILDGVIELFQTAINLIKSNNCTIEYVKKLNAGSENAQTNLLFLSLVEPIYEAYEAYLRNHNEIDFNDMINMASEYVRQGRYKNPYKYVIVDEYQDISSARFNLLKDLRNSSDYDLFCVGDDWQSIYRFAGSDIGYILNFDKYWGTSEISKIETTYRFSQKLIEISSEFIMNNPAQIKKSIRGHNAAMGFPLGEINGYKDRFAVDFMVKRLNDLPKGSTVFLIGRYSFDVKIIDDNSELSCKYNTLSGFVDVFYRRRPDLKMEFLTAHRSKGLQADYVFIVNNKSSRMGFPSKVQDAPILNLLLEDTDEYPYGEERRLFYVALTRAKKKVFLLTVAGQESIFVEELKSRYAQEMKQEFFTCPLCGGRLVKRSGPYGAFWGCTNYRTIRCTYKRKIWQ